MTKFNDHTAHSSDSTVITLMYLSTKAFCRDLNAQNIINDLTMTLVDGMLMI